MPFFILAVFGGFPESRFVLESWNLNDKSMSNKGLEMMNHKEVS